MQKLERGQIISHYEIIQRLGTGGMGEVYLAEDKNLGRKVALKLLTQEWEKNEEFLQRFKQEARSASALNHPNIVTIYQIGEWSDLNFIAMEFVEGSNLRSIMKERPLKIAEIFDITIQTASALSAAHTAGIIHRDIKPENIMVRPDGFVKILDFGLAKQDISYQSRLGEIDSDAATFQYFSTVPGLVLGTAQYMSPEQARGQHVDARSDVWSLAVCLYEMIAGVPPFTGETKTDMLASILKTEPTPLSNYIPEIPVELENIVRKALEKDRTERYQLISDFLLDLKILREELSSPIKSYSSSSGVFTDSKISSKGTQAAQAAVTETIVYKRNWALIVGLIVLLLASSGTAFWYYRQFSTTWDKNILSSLTTTQLVSWKSDLGEQNTGQAKFSPDGKLIAYVASKDGKSSIWLKQINGGEPFTRKTDDSSEAFPLWSPDGERITFYSERAEQQGIWTMPALGGAPVLLMPLESRGRLVYWTKDGSTIYLDINQNLYELNVAAKQINKITNFNTSQGFEHDFAFSPDGERIVYTFRKDGNKDLWVADKSGNNPVQITNDAFEDSDAVWHPDGKRIIYSSNRNGIRQICMAFLDGTEPVQLTFSDSDSFISDISSDGTKILYLNTKEESDLWRISSDGDGKETQITSELGTEFWQDAGGDNETLVYQMARSSSSYSPLTNTALVWQKINGDKRQIKMTDNGFAPRWSPDGNHLAFFRSSAGVNNLWMMSASGGDARALTQSGVTFGGYSMLPFNRLQSQDFDWSSDSQKIIYCVNRNGVSNVLQITPNTGVEENLTSNQDNGILYFNPVFSSDGSRIAWMGMVIGKGRNAPAWSIWVSENGSVKQLIHSNTILGLVGWSANNKDLIVKTKESSLQVSSGIDDTSIFQLSADDSSKREIVRLKACYFYNVKLSPDGKTLAYVTRTNETDVLRTVSIAGGGEKTLVENSDPRVYFSEISFAPDGKTLYYGKQAKWQIISAINNFK